MSWSGKGVMNKAVNAFKKGVRRSNRVANRRRITRVFSGMNRPR